MTPARAPSASRVEASIMIASTALCPPKLFGPAKLAVQVTTCLSSAPEISQSISR